VSAKNSTQRRQGAETAKFPDYSGKHVWRVRVSYSRLSAGVQVGKSFLFVTSTPRLMELHKVVSAFLNEDANRHEMPDAQIQTAENIGIIDA